MEDISAQNVRTWRTENGLTQEGLGDLLGLKKIAVTKIEKGQRGISESERKLLRLLMHGELPFSNSKVEAASSVLEFNEKEWEIIERMAHKEGYSESKRWIVDKIRSYLRMNPESSAAQMAAESPANYNENS